MKRPSSTTELKEQLKADVAAGRLSIGEATRSMHKIVGKNQKDYAKKVLGISPRILMEIERDRGNPTLTTLEKIAHLFGFEVAFVEKRPN